jgi:hypothetical protein
VYVPADDLTDPAPATTFAHLDATTVLSRSIAELGIYPAVDPLDSTSRMLNPNIIGTEHYNVARGVQKVLQDYKNLQVRSEEEEVRGGGRVAAGSRSDARSAEGPVAWVSCACARLMWPRLAHPHRISLPFWAWMSCRKRTSSRWRARARSSASSRSPSRQASGALCAPGPIRLCTAARAECLVPAAAPPPHPLQAVAAAGSGLTPPGPPPPSLRALPQVAEVFTGTPGKYVDLKDTISAFQGILGVRAAAPSPQTSRPGCSRSGRGIGLLLMRMPG